MTTETLAGPTDIVGPAHLTWEELFSLPRSTPAADLAHKWVLMAQRNVWIRNACDPPLTDGSIRLCASRYELRRWLELGGNWSNGTAFAIEEGGVSMCFIQQGECTDEWLVLKRWADGTDLAFESISWHYILTRTDPTGAYFHEMLDRLFAATPEQARTYSY
jgi:hypothetical protein